LAGGASHRQAGFLAGESPVSELQSKGKGGENYFFPMILAFFKGIEAGIALLRGLTLWVSWI
jgi:hypothetical protein